MGTISGFPYAELQFTKEAVIFDNNEVSALQKMLADGAITDLLVISHGWNNDLDDARSLYKALTGKLFKSLKEQATSKKFAVLGVLWPSKKFAEKELIAGGGAASVGGKPEEKDLELLKEQLKDLRGFFDDEESDKILKSAEKISNSIQNDNSAKGEFVQQMNKLFQSVKPSGKQVEEDLIHGFEGANPGTLLMRLEDIEEEEMPVPGGLQGAASIQGAGGAAGIGTALSNVFSAAKNLLNFVTYYQMKERAGKVGLLGLNPVLNDLKANSPALRLHMIGHSFGGRLVTAATAGDKNSTLQVDSLILLQAAFSHYSFSEKYDGNANGFFRSVIKDHKVKGATIITHTHNDSAVGLAYAIASRIARQVAEGIGDATDKYGGMGGNGAQLTPEANNNFHLAKEISYNFEKGKLYNLNSDGVITSHSDICKDEVARAVAAAVNVASS